MSVTMYYKCVCAGRGGGMSMNQKLIVGCIVNLLHVCVCDCISAPECVIVG